MTKFYELPVMARLQEIGRKAGLSEDEIKVLSGESGLTSTQADHMVENAIGTFALHPEAVQKYRLHFPPYGQPGSKLIHFHRIIL